MLRQEDEKKSEFGAPPPPPPGMGPPGSSSSGGLKQKKKFNHEVKLKQLNWNKVFDVKIKKDTFWASATDEREDYLDNISKLFAAKEAKEKKVKDKEDGEKKGPELKVVDANCVKNITIFIGKLEMSFKDFKKKFLEFDEELVTTAALDSLKSIPDILEKFKKIPKKEFEEMVPVLHCKQQKIAATY